MIAFVFLLFVGMFAVAGFFISLEAKRRSDGQTPRPMVHRNNTPKPARSNSDRE